MTYHQQKPYCVDILRSGLDGSFYIGFSSNLATRIHEHNEGRTGYSSKKRPWTLVHVEWFDSKTDAIVRERLIKSKKSREWIERLIGEPNTN